MKSGLRACGIFSVNQALVLKKLVDYVVGGFFAIQQDEANSVSDEMKKKSVSWKMAHFR